MEMELRIAKRQEPSLLWRSALVITGAVVAALTLSMLLLALRGISPFEGLGVLVMGAFGTSWALRAKTAAPWGLAPLPPLDQPPPKPWKTKALCLTLFLKNLWRKISPTDCLNSV